MNRALLIAIAGTALCSCAAKGATATTTVPVTTTADDATAAWVTNHQDGMGPLFDDAAAIFGRLQRAADEGDSTAMVRGCIDLGTMAGEMQVELATMPDSALHTLLHGAATSYQGASSACLDGDYEDLMEQINHATTYTNAAVDELSRLAP